MARKTATTSSDGPKPGVGYEIIDRNLAHPAVENFLQNLQDQLIVKRIWNLWREQTKETETVIELVASGECSRVGESRARSITGMIKIEQAFSSFELFGWIEFPVKAVLWDADNLPLSVIYFILTQFFHYSATHCRLRRESSFKKTDFLSNRFTDSHQLNRTYFPRCRTPGHAD